MLVIPIPGEVAAGSEHHLGRHEVPVGWFVTWCIQ